MLLAIDTSTDTASVALAWEGRVLSELTWHSEQNHSRELLPAAEFLLRQAKATIKDVTAVAVAKGPGSYNGLRVGMSTAKGLCLALGIPLIGVGTLEVEAFPKAGTGLPICPVFEAGRGELAAATYRLLEGDWKQLQEEHITTVEVLCQGIQEPTVFCGQMAPSTATQIRECLGERAIFVEGAALLRRAGYLAELGWRRLKVGLTDDIATLQPLYLRRPAITKPRHR